MNTYLNDLITRMNDKEEIGPGYISSKTNSWKAMREAEKADKIEYVSELREYVNVEKDRII